MIGSGRARRRLDELRQRFERGAHRPSTSTVDAAERLAAAVEAHVGRAEQARAEADRLVQALDLVPQGIVFADASGTRAFTNRAAAGYFEARHGDALVGSAIDDLVAEVVASDAAATRTLELFGPPRRALQLRAVPLAPASGATTGVYLVIEDVSERQRLEAVRRDFVANISHELKTPVGALCVLAETLAETTDPEVVARLAGRVHHEADRVAQTIDDLLELSTIEAGDALVRETVAVAAVVGEAVDRVRTGADHQEVQIVVHPVDPALVVTGDRRQLVSAVSNLCDNAVKYSEPGAVVEVSASAVSTSDVSTGESPDGERPGTGPVRAVEVSVVDHGVGIPASDLGRIFERFYRVDRARSRATGGTGLGLAIVNHVAQNHHGSVTVSSHEGEGSTFTLHIPVLPPSRPDAQAS